MTLAHFVRPLKWIESLDLKLYEVYLATSSQLKSWIPEKGVQFIEIDRIDPVRFAKIVDQAQPIYSRQLFEQHVEEDLKIIDQIKPDLIIGDFRHSLSVSCRLKKIKYLNITNAYWSPEIKMPYPMPEAPIVRFLGEKFYRIFIAHFVDFILKINFFKMSFIIRKSLARANLKISDYRKVITDGDLVVFCDTPELVPLRKKTENEVFIGPLNWSSKTALPDWWKNLKEAKPRIFVSLGSSGNMEILPLILRLLSQMDVEVIVALSGRKIDLPIYKNVYLADLLPVEEILNEMSFVICNGGSPMTGLALSWGVPVIGVVGNNDQLLNMAHVEKRGAGIMLRYWNSTEEKVNKALQKILNQESFRVEAEKLKNEIQRYNLKEILQDLVKNNI